jgi:hypothetical protein
VAEGVNGSAAVLASIQTVRAAIPGWQRTLTAVTTEAGNQNPTHSFSAGDCRSWANGGNAQWAQPAVRMPRMCSRT